MQELLPACFTACIIRYDTWFFTCNCLLVAQLHAYLFLYLHVSPTVSVAVLAREGMHLHAYLSLCHHNTVSFQLLFVLWCAHYHSMEEQSMNCS